MATFFLAALDERVKASAPVAGSLSTRGWIRPPPDFRALRLPVPGQQLRAFVIPRSGALTAPRAQLVCNADADRGFPLDAVTEMVEKMRAIYRFTGRRGCGARGGSGRARRL